MPVENVAAQFAPRVQSPMDVQNALSQSALAQNQLASGRIQMMQAQNDMADTNALREAIRNGADPSTPEGVNALIKASPLKAQAFLKAQSDLAKSNAEAKMFTSHAGEFDASATQKGLDTARSMLPLVKTPEQFGQWVDGLYQNPATAKLVAAQFGSADEVKSRIPTDPAAFQTFLQQNQMGIDKFIANQTQIRGQDVTASTSRANNADNIKKDYGVAGIQASTSRANNAANITKDMTIAGLNGDGSVNGNIESMAKAIAAGQVAPLSGFALARPAGQQVMARVMQINPQYDATEYGAKAKAARDFTSGPQGNAMRSFAVAGSHLDQLGPLVDALGNGNTQLVNKLGNSIATQFGGTAPTNFDAAKDIVSKEVIKAIVGAGGGVSEREELTKQLDNAKSPAQLRGVINQYRTLMSAQHDALLQQRRAAGLPDSSLPAYAPPASPGKVVHFGDLK